MPEPHTLLIHFRIPDAVEPDEYAVRAYEDERLQDMALIGPDEHAIFDAEFDAVAEVLPARSAAAAASRS